MTTVQFREPNDVRMLYNYYAYNMANSASQMYRSMPVPYKPFFCTTQEHYFWRKKYYDNAWQKIFNIREPDIITVVKGCLNLPVINRIEGFYEAYANREQMCWANNCYDWIEDISGKFDKANGEKVVVRSLGKDKVDAAGLVLAGNTNDRYIITVGYSENLGRRIALNDLIRDYFGKCYLGNKGLEFIVNSVDPDIHYAYQDWDLMIPYIQIDCFTSSNYEQQLYNNYSSNPLFGSSSLTYLLNRYHFWLYGNNNILYCLRVPANKMNIRVSEFIIQPEKMESIMYYDGPLQYMDMDMKF